LKPVLIKGGGAAKELRNDVGKEAREDVKKKAANDGVAPAAKGSDCRDGAFIGEKNSLIG
jgi:hypothetical protein